MGDVRDYVDGYYNLGRPDANLENGILFGDISISNPVENLEMDPPTVYFRYLQQAIEVDSGDWPLSHEFAKNENGVIVKHTSANLKSEKF